MSKKLYIGSAVIVYSLRRATKESLECPQMKARTDINLDPTCPRMPVTKIMAGAAIYIFDRVSLNIYSYAKATRQLLERAPLQSTAAVAAQAVLVIDSHLQ